MPTQHVFAAWCSRLGCASSNGYLSTDLFREGAEQMHSRIGNGCCKRRRIEHGWQIDFRVLDVTLANSADSAIFIVIDVWSRWVVCSSLHRDGLIGLIDVLSRANKRLGAPSHLICDFCSELRSTMFREWASHRSIPLYFVPGKTSGNLGAFIQ